MKAGTSVENGTSDGSIISAVFDISANIVSSFSRV